MNKLDDNSIKEFGRKLCIILSADLDLKINFFKKEDENKFIYFHIKLNGDLNADMVSNELKRLLSLDKYAPFTNVLFYKYKNVLCCKLKINIEDYSNYKFNENVIKSVESVNKFNL